MYLFPIFSSDVLDEEHGTANERMDARITLIVEIKFLLFLQEQVFKYRQFVPYILAEVFQCLHQDGGFVDVFVEMDDSFKSFFIGVHGCNRIGELILAVNCLIHQDHFDSPVLEASWVTM